ncbi:uncharacterized protein Triagg1_4300 [Trichoderma aggressivum f. europaeum]|uniref:Mitochondrial division protein 1 n=1 Tax=Trichoderma aggressivum f. europaeum TaxID=173218 RepID=A0AAE1IG61_9HYPO|nr:hypothetical protein Triagg1_4300 [Trichoderma aggressivum f. europaeum]
MAPTERLWDEAYDAIKHEDAKLVEGYERVLSQYLQGHGFTTDSDKSPPNAIIAESPNARRQQMNKLIRVGLDSTAREAKVKDGLGTAMGIVLSFKDMVSTTIAAVPQASIAWSGICVALGVLESAVKETASNRDGIECVITRIRWYGNVSSILIDESTLNGAALSGMKSELEKRLVELYKALLLYQMKSVCSYHRNRGYGFLRDLVKLDNWAVSIQSIQKAENSLRQDTEIYGSQQSRSHLQLIASHAKTQELEIKNIARALEEQQLRREISAEDQNCLKELWPHDPDVEKKRIEDTKGGLLQDSFNWILENDGLYKLEGLGPQAQLSLELNADSVAGAVQIYIKQKVLQLSESKGYKKDREEAVRKYLLENADGTFLWVALVCQTLQRVSAWNALTKSNEAKICKRILAVVTVDRQPLTLQELIALAETPGELDEKIPAICDLIAQCGSFLTIRDEVVYFVHQSAKDFLSGTNTKQTFFLKIDAANDYMAPDPDPLIAIGYPCVFWIDHFVDSITSKAKLETAEGIWESLVDDAKAFIERKYLFLLEALSLLRRIPEGVIAMRKLQEFFKKGMKYDSTGLIRYAYRFILAAKQTIESLALQIHPSALLICPITSRIRQQFLEDPATFFEMKHGMQTGWDSCVQTVYVDLGIGTRIAISPDDKLLASASHNTVQIWNIAGHVCIQTLEGHTDRITSVMFSSDSQQLASAGYNATIRIWDLASTSSLILYDDGYVLRQSVTFTKDGKFLVSGSNDGNIKIWDTTSGKYVQIG